jgi:hypothetical protein
MKLIKSTISDKKLLRLFNRINKDIFDSELCTPHIEAINFMQMTGINKVFFANKYKHGIEGITVDMGKGHVSVAVLAGVTPILFINTFIHEIIHVWQLENNLPLNHRKHFKKLCIRANQYYYAQNNIDKLIRILN